MNARDRLAYQRLHRQRLLGKPCPTPWAVVTSLLAIPAQEWVAT